MQDVDTKAPDVVEKVAPCDLLAAANNRGCVVAEVHRHYPAYACTLKTGITLTPEFERKLLAGFGVNVGLACGHGCTYCSSKALFRCHPVFRQLGVSAFRNRDAIIDGKSVERVERDARRATKRGLVLLCTASDAWSPEAQALGLGRGCSEAILKEQGWSLRVLTKNAAVTGDFGLFEKHRSRVMIGLSTSFLPAHSAAAAVVEPFASSPEERLQALHEAHRLGLRTYGMLCPLIPTFYPTQAEIDEAFPMFCLRARRRYSPKSSMLAAAA